MQKASDTKEILTKEMDKVGGLLTNRKQVKDILDKPEKEAVAILNNQI